MEIEHFVLATIGWGLFALIVTAFAVTRLRDLRLQLAAQVAAIGIYVPLAWIIAGLALAFPPGRDTARA